MAAAEGAWDDHLVAGGEVPPPEVRQEPLRPLGWVRFLVGNWRRNRRERRREGA